MYTDEELHQMTHNEVTAAYKSLASLYFSKTILRENRIINKKYYNEKYNLRLNKKGISIIEYLSYLRRYIKI